MPTGPTMSGPLPEAICVGERVAGAGVGRHFERQVDVRVRGVELLGDPLLFGDLFLRVAAAEAAEPADLDDAAWG